VGRSSTLWVLTRKHDPKSLFLECGLPCRSDFRRRVLRDELASNHCLWAVPASQYRLALSRHEKLAIDDLVAAGGYPKRAQARVVRHIAGRGKSTACASEVDTKPGTIRIRARGSRCDGRRAPPGLQAQLQILHEARARGLLAREQAQRFRQSGLCSCTQLFDRRAARSPCS